MELNPETRRERLAELLREMQGRLAMLNVGMDVPDETALLALLQSNADLALVLKPTDGSDWFTRWEQMRDGLGLNAARRPYRPLSSLTSQRYWMGNSIGPRVAAKVQYERLDPADLDALFAEYFTPPGKLSSTKLAHYVLMRRPDVLALLLMSLIFSAAEQASQDNL